MNKLLSVITSIAMMFVFVLPVFAAGNSAPKATGGYDYSVYGIDRHASFNAIQTSVNCQYSWDVTGNWGVMFVYNGVENPYLYDVSLTQTDGNLTGTGKYPLGVTPAWYEWDVEGTVESTTVSITAEYTFGAVGTTMTMAGTIAPDGTMTGTWNDNYLGGTRTGTWYSVTGAATKNYGESCTGKGTFNYSDENGTWYTVDVQYVSVEGNEAWFAGEVVDGNWGNYGTWLFIKVEDNGETGIGFDESGGDALLTEAQAKFLVATHATPSLSGIVITGGNIQVH